MNYPIHVSDLSDTDCETDEIATLMVIEALLESKLNEIGFIELDEIEIENRLRTWDQFSAYCEIIREQKQLFTSPIANSSETVLSDEEISKANILAHKIVMTKQPQTVKFARQFYPIVSIAASILIVMIGVLGYYSFLSPASLQQNTPKREQISSQADPEVKNSNNLEKNSADAGSEQSSTNKPDHINRSVNNNQSKLGQDQNRSMFWTFLAAFIVVLLVLSIAIIYFIKKKFKGTSLN